MSDNEVEDVSFLPVNMKGPNESGIQRRRVPKDDHIHVDENDSGDTRAHKRTVYEPTTREICRQLICSRNRSILIAIVIGMLILIVAIIAALARPILFYKCVTDSPALASDDSSDGSSSPDDGGIAKPTTPTIPISTNGKPFPWDNIKLPTNIQPETYHIYIHPNLTTLKFTGYVEIRILVLNPTDSLVLHIHDLNITHQKVTPLTRNTRDMKIIDSLEYKTNQQYYLKLESELKVSERIELRLDYEGWIQDKTLNGFYKSMYKTKSNETRIIATTQFEATDARKAFPCFDEPELKAKFSLSMVREHGYITLFNMPLKNTEQHPEDTSLLIDHYERSVKMSTYLVAFVLCDFANITGKTESGIEVRVFTPVEQISQAGLALEIAISILTYYEVFFGSPYPLPKQDLIAIPDFAAGAMENWGLITYRMTSVLFDPEESSSASKQWVGIVIAHELAHQWFGNLVTMKWWNDLWLNEGFASFVEYIGTDHYSPQWQMFDQFMYEKMLRAMHLDGLANSHPIQIPVHNPDEINEIFDGISYAKGASIIRMMRDFLSEDVFKAGLVAYLDRYKYSNAESDDLWQEFTDAYVKGIHKKLNVKTIMDTWTLQMGYPVISLKRTGNVMSAIQERFLLHPPAPESKVEFVSPYSYKWCVPLTYVTSENSDQAKTVWMNMTAENFNIPASTTWIKANYKQTGYYRINYDQSMWQNLIKQLSRNHEVFMASDRAGLMDDVFNLARAGYIASSMALDLSRYMEHETEYIPWTAAIYNLGYMYNRLFGTTVYADFRAYMLKLMKPLLDDMEWKDEGSHLEKLRRMLLLSEAVKMDYTGIVDPGLKLFNDWMKNDTKVAPNLRAAVYGVGVAFGGQTEWDFCWKVYLATNVPSEKTMMLQALGKSRDAVMLSRFLEFSLDTSKIRSQDTGAVLQYVSGNPTGKVLTWRFLRQNWNTISDRYASGSFDMSNIILGVTAGFSSDFDLEEVEQFFKTRDPGSGKRAVKQALESIRMNSDWLKSNKEEVQSWLNANK